MEGVVAGGAARTVAETTCIWCRRRILESEDVPPEHIVPEAVGCPPGLVLDQREVCPTCNHGRLAALNAVLASEFDMVRLIHGIKGKTSRPNYLRSRTNIRMRHGRSGPEVFLNAGPGAVPNSGAGFLPPPTGHERDVRDVIFKVEGEIATVSGSTSFGQPPDFSAAVHAIGLEFVAKVMGRRFVLDPRFDPVRDFVLQGGRREILLAWPQDGRFTEFSPGWIFNSPAGDVALFFYIGTVSFLVDLSPRQELLTVLKEKLWAFAGGSGWTWLPLK